MCSCSLTHKKWPSPTTMKTLSLCRSSSLWSPPLSSRSSSSTPPLPFTWTRTKQNERGFPHRRHRIFFWSEKNIQNKSGRPIGSIGTEDRHFREFFGAGPFVVADVWTLMADHDLIPPDGEIKHLLWTLHFLKAYPKQATVCSTVGGSTSAIDPKTFQR